MTQKRSTARLAQDTFCVGTEYGTDAFGMKRLRAGTFVRDIDQMDNMVPGEDSAVTYFSASRDGEVWHQYYAMGLLNVTNDEVPLC